MNLCTSSHIVVTKENVRGVFLIHSTVHLPLQYSSFQIMEFELGPDMVDYFLTIM